MTAATSSGCPTRPSGVRSAADRWCSSGRGSNAGRGCLGHRGGDVAGATALTLMSYGPSSMANVAVRAWIPALAAA